MLVNEPVVGTLFHMNGFARRLVLTQRLKATRKKWPIVRDLLMTYSRTVSVHVSVFFSCFSRTAKLYMRDLPFVAALREENR